jgi:hypothetical protein
MDREIKRVNFMDARTKPIYINKAVDETVRHLQKAGHEVRVLGVNFGDFRSSSYLEVSILEKNKMQRIEVAVKQDVSNCGGFSEFIGLDAKFKEMHTESFPTIDSLLARVGGGVKQTKRKGSK